MKQVKCIDNKQSINLVIGQQYSVEEDSGGLYKIYNGRFNAWYLKSLFEDIKEENKKVICINNGDKAGLTLNKEYDVLGETIEYFQINNDDNNRVSFFKYRFKLKENMDETNLMPAIVAGNIIELKDGFRGLVIKTPNHTQHVYWFDKPVKVAGTFTVCNSRATLLPNREGIVKIYAGITDDKPYAGMSNHIYNNQELIWEYKLPKVKVTFEQIVEKFNITPDRLEIEGYE